MSNYFNDIDADLQAINEAFELQVAEDAENNQDKSGPTTQFTLLDIRWAQSRIAGATIEGVDIFSVLASWRAQDADIAAAFKGPTHAGGAPQTVALTDEHILIAILLLVREHSPLLMVRMRDFFWFRLPDEVRIAIGIAWGPEAGGDTQVGTRWMTRVSRALHKIIDVMDAYPAERVVMNRAERNHQKALRDINREELNLDVKKARMNAFSFAFIEMSMHMMGPVQLAEWKGSVSIDQTTVKSLGKRGYTKGESQDLSLDSTVMELDAAWAVKDPGRRGEEGSDHKGEAVFGYKANFAAMAPEDPFSAPLHPSLIAGMTISTPGVDVGGEAVELLRQLKVNNYPSGRVTTDKEYAANMKPENYAYKVLALGYTIVTDYQKTRLGVRGHQRGAVILDGKHKCPAIPAKLKAYNQKFILGLDDDEDDDNDKTTHARSRKTKEQKAADLLAHDKNYKESAKYNFKQHEGPDSHGAVKLSCPARGKYATVLCVLHTPKELTKNRDRAVVLNPPSNPDDCCKLEVLTMAPTDVWRDLQVLEHQSPAWRETYKVDRNLVEGANGHIKDFAREALDTPGRRMLRGLTAQQFLVTFLVVSSNLRKVKAYRTKMVVPVEEQKVRKPRSRNALTLKEYAPRNADVRESAGLSPLIGSRRKDAKAKLLKNVAS